MTPKEAAVILDVSPQQVRTLIRTGKLKARKVKCIGGYFYDLTRSEVLRRKKMTRKQMLQRSDR